MAMAGFRVGGGLSTAPSHSPVLQLSIGAGEGAAWLLTRCAPLHLGALPLAHLETQTHTGQPGRSFFSSGKLRQIPV